MKSGFVRTCIAGGMLLVSLSGCGRDAAEPAVPVIVIPVQNDIQTLDPVVLSDPYTSRIVWQIYEGLVGLDQDDNVRPMLAASWQASDDFQTWTFRLRPGVRFHKNAAFATSDSTRAVNAEDVVYSYRRFAKGFGAFVFAGLVEGFDDYVQGVVEQISGFTATDSLTFSVRLTRPDRAFIHRISSPYLGIMPREVVESAPDAFGVRIASGTGPFVLTTRSDTEVRLTRNHEYWQEMSGNVERVTFRVEKNPQFLVSQLQNGTYALAQLPLPFYPAFFEGGELQPRLRSAFRAYTKMTYNVHYVGIDVSRISDALLRQSMVHAVDRTAIVERLLFGQGSPASSPVPPGMLGYEPPTYPPFDPDRARSLLARSTYDGRPLTLLVSDAPYSTEVGELVQSAFRDVGITTAIEKVDFNTLITRVFGNDRPDLFVLFSEWIFSAPEIILGAYDSRKYPNPNMFGFGDPRVDVLLTESEGSPTRDQTNALLKQAEAIAVQAPPALWLYHLRNVYVMDRRLTGFWVSSQNQWNLGAIRWLADPTED